MLERLYIRIDLAQDENDLRHVIDEANLLMDCGYFNAHERMGLILKAGLKAGLLK